MSYIGPCTEVYIHFYCCFSNLKDSRCQISMMPKDAIWAFLIADVCKVSLDLQAHFCLPEWARKWLTIRTGSCIIADVKSVWLASLWKEWPCCQLCKAEPTMFRFMGFFFLVLFEQYVKSVPTSVFFVCPQLWPATTPEPFYWLTWNLMGG